MDTNLIFTFVTIIVICNYRLICITFYSMVILLHYPVTLLEHGSELLLTGVFHLYNPINTYLAHSRHLINIC